MQIIKYELLENDILIGFRKENFVVYGNIGIDRTNGLTKQQIIQKVYEEVKHSIDYETTRFISGLSNSITINETDENFIGENFIPELPKLNHFELITDTEHLRFYENDISKTIDLYVMAKDQYGEDFVCDVVYTTTLGNIVNNVLTVENPKNQAEITITATSSSFSDSKTILVSYVNIIESLKESLINKSKQLLAEYLQKNPLLYADGKYYSLTAEKQSLLNNAIAVYQMKVQAGIADPELKWNSTGEECSLWTIENLSALALAIAEYVEPRVTKQQSIETQIKNCITKTELDAIVIDYEII